MDLGQSLHDVCQYLRKVSSVLGCSTRSCWRRVGWVREGRGSSRLMQDSTSLLCTKMVDRFSQILDSFTNLRVDEHNRNNE